MDIVLLSETGTLTSGRNAFTIEFRSSDGRRVDVRTCGPRSNMPMPAW